MSIATLPDDVPGTAPSLPADDPRAEAPGLLARLDGWTRSNRLFAACFAVAALLRLLVMVAYAPALEFFGDSPGYLMAARHPFQLDIWHPFGYPLLLWLLSPLRTLAVVPLLQHLLGLVSAVLVYRLVRSLQVGSIGATLAASPLLFDAYQLDVEQFVLSDTFFTFLVVVALTLAARLLRQQTLGAAVGLGAVLGLATLTRTVGLTVALAVGLVLVVARVGWKRFAALTLATATPIAGYALAFHASYGVFGLQGYGGRYLYGLVAPFAKCDPRTLPADQRPLCPTLPTYARPGVNQYVWEVYKDAHLPGSAIQRSQLAGEFARPIAMRQAGAVGGLALGTLGHYFEPGRASGPRDWYVGSWQFPVPDRAPAWNISPAKEGFRAGDRVHGTIVTGLAELLRGYQDVVFTPGPALLLALIAAAAACSLRRVDRHQRAIVALMALGGLSMLALPAVSAGFDWRYLLPAQAVLAPAGVVAVSLLAPWVRRTLRRAMPFVAAAVAVALVAPGLASSSVLAAGMQHPAYSAPAPATLPIGKRLTVEIGRPTLLGAACAKAAQGHGRMVGLAAFTMTATWRSGGAQLVQPGNVVLSNGHVAGRNITPAGPQLPDVLVSSRYREVHGTVYADVFSPSGTLRYIDTAGTGTAAWSFHLPAMAGQPPLGTRCTGTAPWAGMQLRYLRLGAIPPFTQLAEQPVHYWLNWQPWRADDYDLRFRVSSPAIAPAPWQYPRRWQHTTLTDQSLLDLTPGVTYCFSVRARDALDAVTDWSVPKCTTRMYDDTSLSTSPDWTRVSDQTGFYFGTYTMTRAQGATASASGTFSRVAVTAYHCPACGSVDVFVGSTKLASLNLATKPGHEALVQWTSPVLPSSDTTLTLRVTSRDRIVAVDGFGLAR